MLTYVEAVKVVEVGFIPLIALWLGQPLYHLCFQLHGDVPWQHRQEELLLLPRTQIKRGGERVRRRGMMSFETLSTGSLDFRLTMVTKAVKEISGHQTAL